MRERNVQRERAMYNEAWYEQLAQNNIILSWILSGKVRDTERQRESERERECVCEKERERERKGEI